MSKPAIWHNPRCSKSRQTLELLHQHGVIPEVVLYLEDAPTAAEIDRVLSLLGIPPRALMRKGEAEYKDQNLADESLSRADLIAAMAKTPKLIERPVVLANGKAAIGRPPEKVLDIL